MSEINANEYKAGLSIDEVRNLAGDQPIVKLSSNENPFGPSPMALLAVGKEVEQAHLYPPRNDDKLKAALAQFHASGFGPEHFFSANGAADVISLVEDALTETGQRAVVTPPCFAAYVSSLKSKGIKIDEVPLVGESFDLDVEAILGVVSDDTRLIYLCNPNNPTGTCFGDDVLDAILSGLPEYVTLIYDEVYYQYATHFNLPDIKKHVLDGRNIVIVHSFSKAYGLAGLRIGYGIAPPQLVKKIETRKRSFHLNSISMSAAIAALQDDEHIRKTVHNNTVELIKLTEGIMALGMKVVPSQGSLVMYQCPERVNAEQMAEAFVKEGIMVRPAFFMPNHIRVSVGMPEENQYFLHMLAKIVQ